MDKLKKIIKKSVPEPIYKFLSVMKRVVFPNGAVNLKKINFIKKHDYAIVLGNGPSLKNDLEKIVKKVDTHDFICVNNFCSSPYYKVFKPSLYVFLDLYFFSEKAHPMWIEQRKKTFETINKETTWNMQIFLPYYANEKILKEFITNPNVEIIKINVYSSNNIKLYNTGYFGPKQCNVLIYAIYLAIWAKYKKIEIYGADLSFHKDVDVDQNDNSLIHVFRHFNKEDEVHKCMKNPERIEPFTMAEFMQTTTDTFTAHEILNRYAKENNILIVNKSSYSLIDAYTRNDSTK